MTAGGRTQSLDRLDATLGARAALRLRLVCPSQEFSAEEMSFGVGRWLSSSRGLWESLRVASEPDLSLVMVQAPPVGPDVEDYLLDLVPPGPTSAADRRARHALVEIEDHSERHLSEKLLDAPCLLRRLGHTVDVARRAGHTVEGLACFASSARMAALARALGLDLLEADPRLLGWGSKSGSRQLFRAAGVSHAPGSYMADHDLSSLAARIAALVRTHGPGQWLVKLDHGFGSGHGNALVVIDNDRPSAVERELRTSLQPMGAGVGRARYLQWLGRAGAVVERRLGADAGCVIRHPSALAHLRPVPGGPARVEPLGVHDQLVGTAGDYLGCRYPARHEYHDEVARQARRVFSALARRGLSGHVGVDFMAVSPGRGAAPSLFATEINVRQTGSTHPNRTVRAVLPLDRAVPGRLVGRDGRDVCFRATDSVWSPSSRGMSAAPLIAALRRSPRLRLDREAGRGVIPHLWPALGRFGKMGVTAIGGSAEECDRLITEFADLLDTLGEAAASSRDREPSAVEGTALSRSLGEVPP
ncbi:ATP-grasp domain-containing protein [Streptomyces sp. NPDC014864]|uniref:ATP-grasp domain-containing protein n=1 Tax=Streptomyces sp. NPDC014864 TaxID=3364924 RepID=UPI0036F788C0